MNSLYEMGESKCTNTHVAYLFSATVAWIAVFWMLTGCTVHCMLFWSYVMNVNCSFIYLFFFFFFLHCSFSCAQSTSLPNMHAIYTTQHSPLHLTQFSCLKGKMSQISTSEQSTVFVWFHSLRYLYPFQSGNHFEPMTISHVIPSCLSAKIFAVRLSCLIHSYLYVLQFARLFLFFIFSSFSEGGIIPGMTILRMVPPSRFVKIVYAVTWKLMK